MKHWLQTGLLFMMSIVSAKAQVPADSPAADDTIHLMKRRYALSTVREYQYHFARHLTDVQLIPLLRATPDSTVRGFIRRARRLQGIGLAMNVAGLGLVTKGLLTPVGRFEVGGIFTTAGIAAFYGSLIPLGQGRRQFQRAVTAHNQFIRSHADAYFTPLFNRTPNAVMLSLADTVAMMRRGLSYRYRYRSAWVAPDRQLLLLVDRVNDPDVKSGMQYSRRISAIGRFVGGLGTSFMTTALLVYGLRSANGSSATLNTPLFWTSVTALSFGFGLRWHADRIQGRAVQLLNERIRHPDEPGAGSEHFSEP